MVETFFGFKKTPFGDSPDAKQMFPSQAWNQVKACQQDQNNDAAQDFQQQFGRRVQASGSRSTGYPLGR